MSSFEDLSGKWNTAGVHYENEVFDPISLQILKFYASYPLITYSETLDSEIADIYSSHPKQAVAMLKAKSRKNLQEYIMHCTQLLTFVESISSLKYTFMCRVNWTVAHRKLFQTCMNEKCTTHILYKRTELSWMQDPPKFCNNRTVCLNQSSFHRQHVADTLQTNYGVSVPAKCPEILQRMQKTCIKNIGYANPFQQPEVIAKLHTPEKEAARLEHRIATNMSTYGVPWFVQTEEFQKKVGTANGTSREEKELVEFLKQATSHEIIVGSFRVIRPKQLDIYIPSLKLAFEFNGTYFHSMEFDADANKHLKKTIACEEKGIKLVHIWEDEWINANAEVKAQILRYVAGEELPKADGQLVHVDRAKFNKCFTVEGYQLVGETEPSIILRAKKAKEKYKVPDCGQLIYKKV